MFTKYLGEIHSLHHSLSFPSPLLRTISTGVLLLLSCINTKHTHQCHLPCHPSAPFLVLTPSLCFPLPEKTWFSSCPPFSLNVYWHPRRFHLGLLACVSQASIRSTSPHSVTSPPQPSAAYSASVVLCHHHNGWFSVCHFLTFSSPLCLPQPSVRATSAILLNKSLYKRQPHVTLLRVVRHTVKSSFYHFLFLLSCNSGVVHCLDVELCFLDLQENT